MTWNFATVASLAVFAATYVLISLQRAHRPSVALAGAVAMIFCGVLSLTDAYKAVNLDTIALLLGMMVVVAYLKLSRFFEYVSTRILQVARTPKRLLVLVVSGQR